VRHEVFRGVYYVSNRKEQETQPACSQIRVVELLADPHDK
jgi:hypothetical protein